MGIQPTFGFGCADPHCNLLVSCFFARGFSCGDLEKFLELIWLARPPASVVPFLRLCG
jgi:hypothetical protein